MPRSASGHDPSQGSQLKFVHPVRVVVYLRTATSSRKAFNMEGDAFHVAIGHFEGHELLAHHSSGGDPAILEMLAEAIADDPAGGAGGR